MTTRFIRLLYHLPLTALILLSGCASPEVEAVRVVNQYLHGLVDQNSNQVSNLSCKAWEAEALMEVDSLQLIKAELDDVSCGAVGREENGVIVKCSGAILTSYNNESARIPLDQHSYFVTLERGDWFLCGYR